MLNDFVAFFKNEADHYDNFEFYFFGTYFEHISYDVELVGVLDESSHDFLLNSLGDF